jgi:selenocysteine lyase/cysteine desulfurase
MQRLEHFKAQFNKSDEFILLNNAGLSQVSRLTMNVVKHWIQNFCEEGDRAIPNAMAEVERTRKALAKLLGTASDQVGFFQSAAGALSQVALGFDFKPNDEIIVWDQEYPSNFYPWKVAAEHSGAKLIIAESGPALETPTNRLLELITPRTKAIAFSWVQYRTGAMTDIKALTDVTKSKGIFTCTDVIQGAGAIPFDFDQSGLDAACGGSHKWMTGLCSAGFLLLQKKWIGKLKPAHVGAISFGTWDDLANPSATLRTGIERFEPGAKGLLDLIAFGRAIELLEQTGIDNIQKEIQRLAIELSEGLRTLDYEVCSSNDFQINGIINFTPTSQSPIKNIDSVQKRLLEKKISFAQRPPGIRLSPHAFNSSKEIADVLNVLS